MKFIDLFAGIGGFHQVLRRYDLECVFASEWDKHASQTYFENYGLQPKGDITQINADEIPKHDILCAGFPCQAFSISGKQKGFEDTRGTLFFDVARIISHHKPKVLFLENVKNFAKHDEGKTLATVKKTLVDLNYDVYHKVLNASHFGLPQNRERIYIVAFRKDLAVNDFTFPQTVGIKTCLNDILEENPVTAKVIDRPDIKIKKHFQPERDIFNEIDLPNKPIRVGEVNKGGQGERIYSPFGHAITLSAYGGGVGSKTGLYLVDDKVRKLTTRECARVQGFPESFIINSSSPQAFKQFGNSVALNVLDEIIKNIMQVVRYAKH